MYGTSNVKFKILFFTVEMGFMKKKVHTSDISIVKSSVYTISAASTPA
jgi:hypothetical protein